MLVDIVSQESLGFVGTSRPTKAARSLLSSCSLRGSTTQWSGATRSPNSHLLVVNNSKTCLWWIVDSGELPRSQRFWTWNFNPSPFGGDLALCYKLWMNVVCFSLSMNWALEVWDPRKVVFKTLRKVKKSHPGQWSVTTAHPGDTGQLF